MHSLATHVAARQYGRLVHLWLPPDAAEARQKLVDLSRGYQRRPDRTTCKPTRYDNARLTDLVSASGGFSHHPGGQDAPATGWMAVSEDTGEGTTAVHALKDVLPDHIAAHRAASTAYLSEPDTYQGGWLDRDTGTVYLDVARSFPESQRDATRQCALAQRQKAYYHLGDRTERYLHPLHDPQMMTDFDAWGKRYAKHWADGIPQQYRSYEHLYPPLPPPPGLPRRGSGAARTNRACPDPDASPARAGLR